MKRHLLYIFFNLFIFQVGFCQISSHASFGTFVVHGDVESSEDILNSFHFGIDKLMSKRFGIRGQIGFARVAGLDGVSAFTELNGGKLIETDYDPLGSRLWYPNYILTYGYLDLGIIYDLPIVTNRFRFNLGTGAGISLSSTNINLYRGPENDFYPEIEFFGTQDEIKESINSFYDVSYETRFTQGNSVNPHIYGQFGLEIRLNPGFSVFASYKYQLQFTDYLDPIAYNRDGQLTDNNDNVSFMTIGFKGQFFSDKTEITTRSESIEK